VSIKLMARLVAVVGVAVLAACSHSSVSTQGASVRYCKESEDGGTEKALRKSCRVGDIISGVGRPAIASMCDLSKPLVMTGTDEGYVCYLAPPR
jgi:hypothetical protein